MHRRPFFKQDRVRLAKMDAITDTYNAMMYGVAYRILRNEEDAEDAVAEALENIFKNLDKISEISCPKTRGYIVTIVRNTSINIYRRNQRRQRISLEEAELHPVYDGENTLARCLDQLPEREKRILILRYWYGYTSAEAAARMGMTEAAARKLLQRAKAKLEVLCKEEGLL